jgi:hypothetical protein
MFIWPVVKKNYWNNGPVKLSYYPRSNNLIVFLILGFSILLRVSQQSSMFITTVRNSIHFRSLYFCFTTCFGLCKGHLQVWFHK